MIIEQANDTNYDDLSRELLLRLLEGHKECIRQIEEILEKDKQEQVRAKDRLV